MDVNTILFSPSSVGKLMTEPREKSPLDKYEDAKVSLNKKNEQYLLTVNKTTKTAAKLLTDIVKLKAEIEILETEKDKLFLSKTAETYLSEVFVQWKYKRRKNIKNNAISKGLQVEQLSADLLSRYLGRMFTTNEIRFANEFLIGTPDIIIGKEEKLIIDLKSSWEIFTFFSQNVKALNDTYYWQLQAYMDLLGATSAQLAYCLIDTPLGILEAEKKKLQWDMCSVSERDPLYISACEELELLHTYSDIPLEERIILIDIPRDNEAIERMHEKIKQGRLWIEERFLK